MPQKLTISQRLLLGLALVTDFAEDIVGGGHRAYQAGKLWFWTPPGYKKPNYYTTVSRLLKTNKINKQIINGVPVLNIGNQLASFDFKAFSLLKRQQTKWDGNWCVVSYDLPEKKRALRDSLRKQLKSIGFGQWQQSVYISPYNFSVDLVDFLEAKDLDDWVWVLIAKHQFLKQPQDFANKIWSLDQLNQKYKTLYNKFSGFKKATRLACQNYLDLLLIDPLLPRELLPKPWWGDKIRQQLPYI